MEFIKLNKTNSPTFTLNGISFYKMTNDIGIEPTSSLIYTLSSDGTYYIVGDRTQTHGNALDSTWSGGEVVIPKIYNGLPVKEISHNAFRNVQNINSVYIPYGIEFIGSNAFEKTGLTSIIMPNSLTYTGGEVFYGCSNLKNAIISNNMKSLQHGIFYNCSSLISITIPKAVNNISMQAFYGTGALTEIRFEHSYDDVLELPSAGGSSSGAFYNKNARNVTIYHRNNPSVLNYDYTGDNITPTFVEIID